MLGNSFYSFAPMWETQIKSLAPGFSLARNTHSSHLGSEVTEKKFSLSLLLCPHPSLSLSVVLPSSNKQNLKFLKKDMYVS